MAGSPLPPLRVNLLDFLDHFTKRQALPDIPCAFKVGVAARQMVFAVWGRSATTLDKIMTHCFGNSHSTPLLPAGFFLCQYGLNFRQHRLTVCALHFRFFIISPPDVVIFLH